MATSLIPASASVTDLDGGVIILPAADAVEIARRRDRVAKRARDDGGVALCKEADSRGWSSAVLERCLALRRRRGPAPCSRRGCGLIVGAADPSAASRADEYGCCFEEAATPGPGAVIGGSVAKKTAVNGSPDLTFFYLAVL